MKLLNSNGNRLLQRMTLCSTVFMGLLIQAPFADEAQVATEITLSSAQPVPGVSESLLRETLAAVERSQSWLLQQQQADGHWSNPEYPALTALPLWALAKGGCTDQEALKRAVEFILKHVHEDGSIYREVGDDRKGGGLPNYNTALCMVALHALKWPELDPVILAARRYMAKEQHLTGGDVYHGGFGYDPRTGRPYADLSNSYLGYEAMRLTEDVEDRRPDGLPKADLDWQAAVTFLERVHNDPAVNTQSWVNSDPDERGGFAYHPEQTRAGTITDSNDVVRFRSMPGMTYAGLLSYIYADVDRQDPRVRATVDWIQNHWNLRQSTRDPAKIAEGLGREGLFYMYNVISKGLDAYGVDVFHPDQATPFNWRVQLIERLLAEQKITPDGLGYWLNDVNRYWEGDPTLVTSYSILALLLAAGD